MSFTEEVWLTFMATLFTNLQKDGFGDQNEARIIGGRLHTILGFNHIRACRAVFAP